MSLSAFARASAATLAASTAALTAAEHMGSDAAPVRSFRFWRSMLPIYAHYRFVQHQLRHETDPHIVSAAFEPLHHRYAPTVQHLALSLRGFYYKLAQILSTRDDFFPPPYLSWMQALQDRSPVVLPPDHVRARVEQSLQSPLHLLFSQWQDDPIGAASVGQVHRAIWRSTGEPVAVKIIFPGVERQFRADIHTVELFCRYLMPQNASYFQEIKKQFATEFDARGEADNLREVYQNIQRAGWANTVAVPRPLHASKDVLVMTFLPGVKLVDGVRANMRRLASAQGITPEELERQQKQKLETGLAHPVDLEESAARMLRVRRFLKVRDTIANLSIWMANSAAALVVRAPNRSSVWSYCTSELPINLAAVMETLVRVHGHEILHDGAFNGDPHPGNVLLMPDGRLGLVDYGQVKRMSSSDRVIYAKLVVALDREDRDEVVRIMSDEIGFQTRDMNPDVIYRTAAFFNCRDSDDITMGMNVSEFMDWLQSTDPVRKINDEFVMAGRVSVLLRGVANAFGLKVRVARYWRPEAEAFLRQQGIEY